MAEYCVKFRLGDRNRSGSYTELTVRASDSAEAERIVRSKYSQTVTIIDVRKR